jgi:hypothetical protein
VNAGRRRQRHQRIRTSVPPNVTWLTRYRLHERASPELEEPMEATLSPRPAAPGSDRQLQHHEHSQALLSDPQVWEADRAVRYELETFNRACREAVPVLQATGWLITKIERGFAETLLPLNVASTNQFVTHQAALMLVAADYTGGIAVPQRADPRVPPAQG